MMPRSFSLSSQMPSREFITIYYIDNCKRAIFEPRHNKKSVLGVFDQVLNKLGCSDTEDG